MTPQQVFVLILIAALFNGLVSPALFIMVQLVPFWLPYLLPGVAQFVIVPELIFYVSSLTVATGTLLLSGVPAALYERIAGADPEATAPLYIWLAGALGLCLPAFARLNII